MDQNATLNFHGAEVNLAKEYHQARQMMGRRSTDLNDLYRTVSHLYICIPEVHEEWAHAYYLLMGEIQQRQTLMATMKRRWDD